MNKYIRNFLIILGLITTVYGLFFADSWIKGNFHVITENEVKITIDGEPFDLDSYVNILKK